MIKNGTVEKWTYTVVSSEAKSMQYHVSYIFHPNYMKNTYVGGLRLNRNKHN